MIPIVFNAGIIALLFTSEGMANIAVFVFFMLYLLGLIFYAMTYFVPSDNGGGWDRSRQIIASKNKWPKAVYRGATTAVILVMAYQGFFLSAGVITVMWLGVILFSSLIAEDESRSAA